MTTVPRWIDMLDTFEGRVGWMYLDGAGNVTAGVGHLIATPEDAVTLFGDARAAKDWQAVKAMAPGHLPPFYANTTVCRLTDAEIDIIKANDVDQRTKDLAYRHPPSVGWPDGPRDGCLDVFYNTGKLFPHMIAAMDAGYWETAAAQSHRIEAPASGGIQPSRNAWTKKAILSAVPVPVSAPVDSPLT